MSGYLIRYALLTLAFLCPLVSGARVIEGRVVAVADGDTLTLLDEARALSQIRIVGIDAPEKRQGFGQRSKASLAALAFNHAAKADCRKIDRYKRNLCVVSVGGRDVGLEQIRAGMAWHYKHYAKEQPASERVAYERAENEAKAKRLGLWVDADPVPPWDWRRNNK